MYLHLAGSVERSPTDCRTEGCGKNAECIREGAVFVCRCPPGTTGRAEVECVPGKTRNSLFNFYVFDSTGMVSIWCLIMFCKKCWYI